MFIFYFYFSCFPSVELDYCDAFNLGHDQYVIVKEALIRESLRSGGQLSKKVFFSRFLRCFLNVDMSKGRSFAFSSSSTPDRSALWTFHCSGE